MNDPDGKPTQREVDELLADLGFLAEPGDGFCRESDEVLEPHTAAEILAMVMEYVAERRVMPEFGHLERANRRLRRALLAIAAVLERSFVECGEEADLADDEALELIRTVALAADPTLLDAGGRQKRARALRKILEGESTR